MSTSVSVWDISTPVSGLRTISSFRISGGHIHPPVPGWEQYPPLYQWGHIPLCIGFENNIHIFISMEHIQPCTRVRTISTSVSIWDISNPVSGWQQYPPLYQYGTSPALYPLPFTGVNVIQPHSRGKIYLPVWMRIWSTEVYGMVYYLPLYKMLLYFSTVLIYNGLYSIHYTQLLE